MRKGIFLVGALLISASLFAHDHFMYTDNIDVSGKNEVKMKVILGHPAEGKEEGTISVGTVDGKTTLPKDFFVVHNGQKQDLKGLVKQGKIKTHLGETVTFDAVYGKQDGLKGGGSWVFVMNPGETKDSGYHFYPIVKLIVTKDSAGSDYNQRVAPGYDEIIPLLDPVNAWKDNVFRGKFVDKDGNPIKNARVDIDLLNVNIDLAKDTYVPNDVIPKSSLRVFTDDNGVFAFVPSKAGKWVIRAVRSIDRDKHEVHDSSLVVQFE